MPTFSATRAAIVMSVIALALLGMTGRVAYLETYKRQQTIRSADRQQHQNLTTLARRGSIFDFYGNAMALTVQTLNIYIDPEFVQNGYEREGRDPNQMPADLRKLSLLLEIGRAHV
jgi:cell division protein FtsI (penicillin-binding protein 3)